MKGTWPGRSARGRYAPLAAALFFINIMNVSRNRFFPFARVLAREIADVSTWMVK
jgi:hypothetical protein